MYTRAGNLFGTTSQGGNDCQSVCGTIFMIDTFNHESVLYSFTGGSDGGNPTASLVMDAKGNPYGTTSQGRNWLRFVRLWNRVFEFPFDDDAKYAVLNGHNTFNGNQIVNGFGGAQPISWAMVPASPTSILRILPWGTGKP